MPRGWFCCALVVGSWAGAASCDESPQLGYVNADDAFVRSGPGKQYYPTDKLGRGTEVEIYRHDAGGWLAIRPPEGSFSWVAGKYVERTEGDLAVATEEGVASRVGSALSDIRDAVQVRLKRGEAVEVLEALRIGERPDEETWYKIAPPAGEFRWIHERAIDRDETDALDNSRVTLMEEDQGPTRHSPLATRHIPHQATRVDRDEDESSAIETAGFVSGAKRSWSPVDPARRRPSSPISDEVEAASFETRPIDDSLRRPVDVDEELDEIDLAVSLMAANEPRDWDFAPIRARAEAAMASGASTIERGRARVLLSRIERFADLQERSRHLVMAAASPAADSRPHDLETQPEESVDRPRGDERFDGEGRLASVLANRPGGPQYALFDERGDVACYVSPAPGVNLRQYVGRQVGVTGHAGVAPTAGARHVTAKRLTVLGTVRR